MDKENKQSTDIKTVSLNQNAVTTQNQSVLNAKTQNVTTSRGQVVETPHKQGVENVSKCDAKTSQNQHKQNAVTSNKQNVVTGKRQGDTTSNKQSVAKGKKREDATSNKQNNATHKAQNAQFEQLNLFGDVPQPVKSQSRKTILNDEKKLRKVKELSVFTFAKQMTEYVFVCTKKAPKSYRWSIVGKMHNYSLDFLEQLYLANVQPLDVRKNTQMEADAKLKLLMYVTEMAKNAKVISVHQFKTLSNHCLNCKKTLWGWIKCKK